MSAQYEAAAREAAGKPVRFGFCGEQFHTHVEVDGLLIMEISAAGYEDEESGLDLDDLRRRAEGGDTVAAEELGAITQRQIALFYRFLSSAMPAREFARFKRVCSKRRPGADDIILKAVEVLKAMTGRPTGPSSNSAGSPDETGRSSTTGELVGVGAPLGVVAIEAVDSFN
jgi:hypothetical protein